MLSIALTWCLVKFNFKIIEYEYEANTITKFKSRFSDFISKLNKRKQILLCYFFQENCYENFLLIMLEHLGHLLSCSWQLKTQYYLASLNTLRAFWLLTIYLLLRGEWAAVLVPFIPPSIGTFRYLCTLWGGIWWSRNMKREKTINAETDINQTGGMHLLSLSPISNCKMHLPHFWNVST